MAKYYVLNTLSGPKRSAYGGFTVDGCLVPPNTRFPLEEGQLEAEYDHLKSLWKDGAIQVRETATGHVFSFPEKVIPKKDPDPKVEVKGEEEPADVSPEVVPDPVEEDNHLDNVVPLHSAPPSHDPEADSAAGTPLSDFLDMVKEPEPEPEPERPKRGRKTSRKG